jgi:2-polyprenyl-3-methyl-5-hydroxy-6-metoxy-1,4-benzoquinol methylase
VIGIGRFRDAYRSAVVEVMRFVTPERQEVLARHNRGLHPDHTDLRTYLDASERRYARIVKQFDTLRPTATGVSALDVGGFLGALPLALTRCGLDVTLVEEYGYYHGAFDELRDFLVAEGVQVWAQDFTSPVADAPPHTYQLVMNLAMLEHLPSSPMPLLRNLRTMTDPDGLLFVDVPNIAYWPNRLRLLRGKSIHQPLEFVYDSEPPFLGHHREYTRNELVMVLSRSGFSVVTTEAFNYTPKLRGLRTYDRVMALVVDVLPSLLTSGMREVLLAVATPDSTNGQLTAPR